MEYVKRARPPVHDGSTIRQTRIKELKVPQTIPAAAQRGQLATAGNAKSNDP
jgi:hypothetical protein